VQPFGTAAGERIRNEPDVPNLKVVLKDFSTSINDDTTDQTKLRLSWSTMKVQPKGVTSPRKDVAGSCRYMNHTRCMIPYIPSTISIQGSRLALPSKPKSYTARSGEERDGQRLSPRAYAAYRLFTRPHEFSLIHRAGRLFQQYCVDTYAKVEQTTQIYERQPETIESRIVRRFDGRNPV
jgi:hypothetical protein